MAFWRKYCQEVCKPKLFLVLQCYKGLLNILICNAVIHFYSLYLYLVLVDSKLMSSSTAINYVFKEEPYLLYLLYPFFGWLADVHITRFTAIVSSLLIISAAQTLGAFVVGLAIAIEPGVWYAMIAQYTLSLIGIGLFVANAIQFGTDQMIGASAEELSTFIHWYFWSTNCLRVFLNYAAISLISYCNSTLCSYDYIQLLTMIISLVLVVIALFLVAINWRKFLISPVGYSPIVPIAKVLKFAAKNKHAIRRSAMTYWEDEVPSRLDLAKDKYGGPFTTEQVEDTKTFFQLCVLLLCGYGYSIIQDPGSLQESFDYVPPVLNVLLTEHSANFTHFMVIMGIPVFRLLILPILEHLQITMLQRMWIGYVFSLLAVAGNTSVECLVQGHTNSNATADTNNSLNYYNSANDSANSTVLQFGSVEANLVLGLLAIGTIFHAMAYIFIGMTSYEFIIAQAPQRMQGLLIGMNYAMGSSFSLTFLLLQLPIHFVLNTSIRMYLSQTIAALGVILSFAAFSFVSKWYRYRKRDDVVNEQALVEETYDRILSRRQEEEYAILHSSDLHNYPYSSINSNSTISTL